MSGIIDKFLTYRTNHFKTNQQVLMQVLIVFVFINYLKNTKDWKLDQI